MSGLFTNIHLIVICSMIRPMQRSYRLYQPKVRRLILAEEGLFLGRDYGVIDKTKPVQSVNIKILLLNRRFYLIPPKGGIKNQRCKQPL